MAQSNLGQRVDTVRRFNRFYTRQIGLLDEHLSHSPFSLPEARVLYELAAGNAATAAQLSRALDMDKSQLSRILARFRSQKLLTSRPSLDHAKHRLLSLTRAGRTAFSALEDGTVCQMQGLLAPLDSGATHRLIGAMQGIQAILSDVRAPRRNTFTLRSLHVGDLGWVVHRQAVLYGEEYGWDWTYEALIAGIMAEFVAHFLVRLEGIASSLTFTNLPAFTASDARIDHADPSQLDWSPKSFRISRLSSFSDSD